MKAPSKLTPFATVYAFSALLILVFSAIHRGPWLDEFWSLWVSDGTISLETILKTRWLVDIHPPMYPALLYAVSKLIPLDIISGRLLNLAPLFLSAAFLIYMYSTDRRLKRFIFLFSLAIASSYYFAAYFPELRSYFVGLCSFSVMIICLRKFCEDLNDLHETSGNGIWTAFFISVFVCLNFHYITALFSAIVVATFGWYFLFRRRIDYFLKFTAVGILSAIPLLAFAITNVIFLKTTSGSFWIDTSTLEGISMILKVLVKATAPQFVLCLVIAGLIARGWRNGKLSGLNETGILNFSVLLAISIALFVPTLVMINLKLPIIQERYVMPLAICCLAIISNICELADFNRKIVRTAFIMNCIILTLFFGIRTSMQERWYASARIVKQHLESCPSSRVIASVWKPSGVRNEELVVKLGYEYTSKTFSIPLDHLEVSGTSSRSNTCPDIIWIEHVDKRKLPSLEPNDITHDFIAKNINYSDYDISVEIDAQKEAMVLLAKKRAAGIKQ
jgi:hypothetical protein